MLTATSPLLEGQNVRNAMSRGSFEDPKSERPHGLKNDWSWSIVASIVFNSAIIITLLYGFGICLGTINATLMPVNEYCLHTVSTSYNYLTFAGEGYGSFFGPTCLNPLRVTSTYASGKTFCTEREIDVGFEKIRKDCEKRDYEFLDWRKVVANITDDDVANMRVVEFEDVPSIGNLTEPILLSKPFYQRVGNTLITWEYEMNWHHKSGAAVYAFWGLVLTIAAITNLLKSTNASFEPLDSQSRRSNQFLHSSWRWIRTNLIIPPTFGSHHQRLLFWCTIPTRMETLIVTLFYLFTTYLAVSHYRLISNNIYWDERSQQLWRYVADRTGIMSYATLPLIWVFAGRNNAFMWATGLSYQAFNIYHRHIARAGTILAIVHSIVYTYLFIFHEGLAGFMKELTDLWLILGVLATVAMSLLLLFSFSWLRIKFYEVFLVLHIALSLIVLIGCFLHTSIFHGRYDAYLWPVAFVWVLDRGLRLLRLLSCNLHIRFSKSLIGRTHATASYSKASDVIRVDITTNSLLTQPEAGQFYYIYQPTTWQGYENHPFTLGSWSSSTIPENDVENPLLEQTNTYQDLEQEIDRSHKWSPSSSTTLTFYIRPYDGWTKRLRNSCVNSPNQTTHPLLLLEGPYGHHRPLVTFPSVLLIAGGTGIASAIPYMLEHTSLSRPNTQNVHLIWTSRQASFIREVFSRDLLGASQREDFSTELFHTRQESAGHKSSQEDDGNENMQLNIKFGRPDIKAVIEERAVKAKRLRQKLAVLVCGPPGMADEARGAVHGVLKKGCDCVEYFEESFGW